MPLRCRLSESDLVAPADACELLTWLCADNNGNPLPDDVFFKVAYRTVDYNRWIKHAFVEGSRDQLRLSSYYTSGRHDKLAYNFMRYVQMLPLRRWESVWLDEGGPAVTRGGIVCDCLAHPQVACLLLNVLISAYGLVESADQTTILTATDQIVPLIPYRTQQEPHVRDILVGFFPALMTTTDNPQPRVRRAPFSFWDWCVGVFDVLDGG